VSALVTGAIVWSADWPSLSGSPQREGWAKAEKAFTKENVGSLDLLYKFQADNQAKGLDALTSPIVDGMLITYLGFKEMLVFGGSSDNVYSVDADLNRIIWKRHFDYQGDKQQSKSSATCPGGLTAALAMPGSSTVVARRGIRRPPPRTTPAGPGAPTTATPPGTRAAAHPEGAPPAPAPNPQRPAGLLASGFGRLGAFLAISSDGYLHILNTSTGENRAPDVKFVPANANLSSINIDNEVVYAATQNDCGGSANALYAVDLSSDDHKVASRSTNGSGFSGAGGTAIGTDGTIYAQAPDGHDDTAGVLNDTVLAMAPKTLEVKDYFTPEGESAHGKKNIPRASVTPVVFSWKGKDVIVAGGRDGRLYLLDSSSLGGANHHEPLYQSEPIASPDIKYAGNGFWGTFASWEDSDTNTRWVYASLWGPPNPSAKFPVTNGDASHGSIVAFKVIEQGGKPALAPAWNSPDIPTPAPVVTANGLVFALSTGESPRQAKENGSPYSVAEREKMATHAILYALDGETGKQLYSSGDAIASFSHGSGLAIANRRIYFTTHDNLAYSFGFIADQPQLTGR
jgi:WD40 repeat protein